MPIKIAGFIRELFMVKRPQIFIILLFLLQPVYGREVKISFTGDIIMHNAVKKCAFINNKPENTKSDVSLNNRGFDYLFKDIKGEFKESDIVFGNMEFPVSPPFNSRKVIFNCPPGIIPALRDAGFNFLSIANNHILDQGARGLRATIRHLNEYGVSFIGAAPGKESASCGTVINLEGMRIGFIAYTGIFNYPLPRNPVGFYVNDLYKKNDVARDIKAIRKRCDYLIMSVHTGEEYKTVPLEGDVRYIKSLAEGGVDLVAGHHPHVLQYIEKYKTAGKRDCYIFYSLGNFISNQQGEVPAGKKGLFISTAEAVILNLYLGRINGKISPRFEIVPVMTENKRAVKNGCPFRDIRTVSIPAEIKKLKALLETSKKKEKKNIKKRIQYLKKRLKAVKEVLLYKQNLKEIEIKGAGNP